MNYDSEYITEKQKQSRRDSGPLDRTASPMQATFHLLYPFLGLCPTVCGNRLTGTLAKVSKVYGKASDGLADP
jgi:hypothetical protein